MATKDNAAEHERSRASVLTPGNVWAHKAPVLAISVATIHRGDKPNRTAHHDLGLANENLVIQAVSMGLAVHMMAGFHIDMAREVFDIPATHDPLAMMAIGYLGDPAALSEELRAKDLAPRQRKPIREFVFRGKFGQPAGLE